MLGIYVHIPFCRTLCPYCDFARQRTDGLVPDIYTNALIDEIAVYEGPVNAGTIFFGGGTPSLLPPRSLEKILQAIQSKFILRDAEISIEANPDDVTAALADSWRVAGVNRASLGVQSFDEGVLKYLGRRHDADKARRACDIVRERFANWSLDLIFGARPVDAWAETLEAAVALRPNHISAYGLTYEPATPFGARAHESADDETWLRLYRHAHDTLGAHGYDHYEISNYALPGYQCRHNLVYWHNEEYAGFGAGAYSFINGVRARNFESVQEYLSKPREKAEAIALTDREVRLETVIQYLRLDRGIEKADYARRFGGDLFADFGVELARLARRGLVERTAERVRPTRAGFELNNEIGLELISLDPFCGHKY